MEVLLTVVIIFLILFVWFMVSTDGDLHKKYKDLQKEHSELKTKYEAQKFELRKYQNEEIKKNKEFAKEFLTDTAFWMRKTFAYAKENRELKKKKKE